MVALALTTSTSPGAEGIRQVAQRAMPNAVVRRVGHQQPNAVARESTRFGRFVRDERVGQREVQRVRIYMRFWPGARNSKRSSHAATDSVGTRDGATSDATYRPLGKSPSSIAMNPGTFDSGSGRSLMSSPGYAA